jgi:hypothetical protein
LRSEAVFGSAIRIASERIVARVQAADAAELERFAERIITAASPEEIIES